MWCHFVFPSWQLPPESSAELIWSDCNTSKLGVSSQDFLLNAGCLAALPLRWAYQSAFAVPCVYWSEPVISEMALTCNWTSTFQTLWPPLHNLWTPFHLGCQDNEGLISILSLISLFTALWVNADSKLQQAAVKHVINTAWAANETLLLGSLHEL